MGTRNIMVRAGADFSQLSQAFQRAQGEASGFGSHMESILTRIGLVGMGLKTVFETIVHGAEALKEFAQEAGELDGRLSSLNARLGSSAQSFQDWANANGQALGLSRKDMIEQGASISAMLQTSISDKQKLAQETEQMLKNIAIVSSATGKSQKDVSERMVSALQGHSAAVSALDLNMHLSSMRMSESYKRIAGSTPWAKLTAEQQQMIIVSNLNEQVQQKFGNTVAEDVATRMNRFTAALSDVKTNLEQAFQPILYAVLPVLTTFINYINTALQYVTVFFQTLFGYSGYVQHVTDQLTGQSDAVNDLADSYDGLGDAISKSSNKKGASAVKVPKVSTGGTTVDGGSKSGTGFTASFDQVHTIPEATKSGGGGAGAGASGGAGGVPDVGGGIEKGAKKGIEKLNDMQTKVKEFVDKVKKFLEPVTHIFMEVWGAVSTYFKGVIDQISKWWSEHGDRVIQAFKNIWNMVKPIIMFLAKFLWDSIKGAIDGIVLFFEGLIEFISDVFTGHWKDAFGAIWKMIVGFIEAVWNIFNLTLFGGIKKILLDLVEVGAKAFIDLAKFFKKPLLEFIEWLVKAFSDTVTSVFSFFKNFGTWLYQEGLAWGDVFRYFWKTIIDGASGAWNGLKWVFGGVYDWFMQTLVYPITSAFNNIANGIGGSIMGGVKAVWNTIADDINSAIGLINGITGALPNGGALNISWRAPHMFAKGGIVTGATNAIVGEAGTEVIQPLSQLQGMVASTVAQTIATVMSMQKGSKNNVSGDLILNIDGKQFARIIKPYTDIENKRVGTNVRLQSL